MYSVFNALVCYVSEAIETRYQEEADCAFGSREMRGPTPVGAMVALLSLQRRCEHLELRDTFANQEI